MLNHFTAAVMIGFPILLLLQLRETFGGKRSHRGHIVRHRKTYE